MNIKKESLPMMMSIVCMPYLLVLQRIFGVQYCTIPMQEFVGISNTKNKYVDNTPITVRTQ